MNHYERLKVSQDAPAEVIRAAYRALAAKLHPDRQGGGAETGPDDAMHTQMAALNAAYEVLIDPKLRREYDATVAPSRPAMPLGTDTPFDGSNQAAPNRVDMDWLGAKAVKPTSLWPPSRRLMILGGSGLAVLILTMTGVLWREAGQHKMERALSDQYAAHPVDATAPATADVQTAAASRRNTPGPVPKVHRPSVEELAKMSDEELLKVLPTLDAEPTAGAAAPAAYSTGRAGNVHHPLDGKPLALRTEIKLFDPLASHSAAAPRPTGHP